MMCGDLNLETSRSEYLVRCPQDLGMKVVVPRIRPQHQRGPIGTGALAVLRLEASPGELRQRALGRHPGNRFYQSAQPGNPHRQIGKARSNGAEICPTVHKAEEVMLQR